MRNVELLKQIFLNSQDFLILIEELVIDNRGWDKGALVVRIIYIKLKFKQNNYLSSISFQKCCSIFLNIA